MTEEKKTQPHYLGHRERLRKKLLEQPEEEAHDLALALELFTEGSLDVFAHKTNVDVNNRIIDYNIHDLRAQLKPSGLLTITDAMLNRVTSNWKKESVLISLLTSSTSYMQMNSAPSFSIPPGDSSEKETLIRARSHRTLNICWHRFRQARCCLTPSLLLC